MAVLSSGGMWPLIFSSRTKNSITPALTHSYSKPFSTLCSFKYSHKNSLPEYPNTIADKVLADIQNSGIIACLRAQSAEVAIEAARAAFRGGISVLEVVMSTPCVFEVLQCLVQEYPSASIGVGTVLDIRDAKNAIKLGAKFLMSPVMVKDMLDDVAEGQALYIPGVMTPTEVYPVSALGGVQYIAAVRKPFPHIPMVASQGIIIGEQGTSSPRSMDAICAN
ncbi:hypothetical protein ACJIZ3_005529 [Penstemon smallii]|uniref:KHG/KDPG aldolase n=1 Tax=Penstemon smallii TaxID=265156 RepID=A0ABD3S549_9LAMI